MDKNSYEIRLCELISASLECCLAAVSFAWSFISPLALVHPFPLRGPSPQGETRRDGTPLLLLKHAKYSAELATFGGSPPYPALPDSPPKGETTHYILRVAIAPSKCVRCASTGKRVTRFSGCFAPLQHGYHRLTIFCASLRSFIHCCH